MENTKHRPEIFDLVVIAFAILLLLLISVIIVRGDQVGIQVQSFSPVETGSSRSVIQVSFDEPVNLASFEAHFTISPAVQGSFSVTDRQLVFQSRDPLIPGQVYQVPVGAGILAVSGRQLKQAVSWQFHIRSAQMTYLGPWEADVQNLYLIDPAAPRVAPQQLTNSQAGITNYDVAPDGSKIVYSQPQPNGQASLYVLDMMNTRQSTVLYACPKAACQNPEWRPDGGAVAFERIEYAGGLPTLVRVWLWDSATNTVKPLFKDNQQVSATPRWSPDGTQLAVFSLRDNGLVIHDFSSGKDTLIPGSLSDPAQFSPDGKWLAFRKLVNLSDNLGTVHTVLVDLSTPAYQQHDLKSVEEPVEDTEVLWMSDSHHVIVGREPLARQAMQGPQLYEINTLSGAATLLVPDNSYNQAHLRLSPVGDAVVFERFLLGEDAPHLEIWEYTFATRDLKLVLKNSSKPNWLP